jgi:Zn-dependent peptidase ImmA (M78 family)
MSEWLQQEKAEPAKLPRLPSTMPPELVGRILRSLVGVDIQEQLSWESANIAFSAWRAALSGRGIQIFVLQLGGEGIRGFSCWNDWIPIIGVNSSYNTQARIFTVFHECAHLLARESAACTDVSPKSKKSPLLERWCERVAAAALLPPDAVGAVFADVETNDLFETVEAVSAAFGVSLRAAAIRIGDLELVEDPDGLYQLVDSKAVVWDREKGFARSTVTRDRVAQRLSEVGPEVVSIFDQALTSGYVHERDLQDHIRLDPVEFEEAKSRLDLVG